MKIRMDYVTNSSSTSYMIICDGDFSVSDLANLMGVSDKSPLSDLAVSLYDIIRYGMRPARSAWEIGNKYGGDFYAYVKEVFSDDVLQRVKEAEKEGKNVFVGSFASDETEIENYFCCDSFEWENNKIYFNALRCVW